MRLGRPNDLRTRASSPRLPRARGSPGWCPFAAHPSLPVRPARAGPSTLRAPAHERLGLTPARAGHRGAPAARDPRRGLTPARAGHPGRSSRTTPGRTADPRARGAPHLCLARFRWVRGLPPHARGRRVQNTCTTNGWTVEPRTGGERVPCCPGNDAASVGPRVRGAGSRSRWLRIKPPGRSRTGASLPPTQAPPLRGARAASRPSSPRSSPQRR